MKGGMSVMGREIYISILDAKNKKAANFVGEFWAFHNQKRHMHEKKETHSLDILEDQDGYYIVISTRVPEKESHMIETMGDVLEFLVKNPEFQDIDLWGEKLEITGRFV
jgi:hypothetical protein